MDLRNCEIIFLDVSFLEHPSFVSISPRRARGRLRFFEEGVSKFISKRKTFIFDFLIVIFETCMVKNQILRKKSFRSDFRTSETS